MTRHTLTALRMTMGADRMTRHTAGCALCDHLVMLNEVWRHANRRASRSGRMTRGVWFGGLNYFYGVGGDFENVAADVELLLVVGAVGHGVNFGGACAGVQVVAQFVPA